MGDKETLVIKCDCGKEHQLWDRNVLYPDHAGSELYTFACESCGKLFNIQVIEKEFHSMHEESVKCHDN